MEAIIFSPTVYRDFNLLLRQSEAEMHIFTVEMTIGDGLNKIV